MANLRFCPGCVGGNYGRVRVDYAKIMNDFTDRGQFGPDIHALARATENFAEKLAPKRTGRLKKEHYRRVMPARGYQRDFWVGNRAGYAKFILGGTRPVITGRDGPMELRPIPYSWFRSDSPGRFKEEVSGQKAYNWLGLALKLALYVHSTGRLPKEFEGLG